MKISLGMVIRDFISPEPVSQFLQNAYEYGHKIDCVIIAYSGRFDQSAYEAIDTMTDVVLLKINRAESLQNKFKELNISEKATKELLYCPYLDKFNMVPYGFNRNTVLMQAAINGCDVLIFVDSDVKPEVLIKDKENSLQYKSIDFIGRHINEIKKNADITTSDYSGYNILPPANFADMDSLLIGLQKEEMKSFWEDSVKHNCLTLQKNIEPKTFITKKALGGNLGINLCSFSKTPPFFSPVYLADDNLYLARGEDTLISILAKNKGLKCIDIDTHIFHDTFENFPQTPDLINDTKVQQRFFIACTGWIGRNPFMNWLNKIDIKEEKEKREEQLKIGSSSLYQYTRNNKFLELPNKFKIAYASLPDMIDQYNRTIEAWNELIRKGGF